MNVNHYQRQRRKLELDLEYWGGNAVRGPDLRHCERLRAVIDELDARQALETFPGPADLRNLPPLRGRRAHRDPAVEVIAESLATLVAHERVKLVEAHRAAKAVVDRLDKVDAGEAALHAKQVPSADLSAVQYPPGAKPATPGDVARFAARHR